MATKKSRGRPKGSPNVLTSELRTLLKELLVSELAQAEKVLKKCTLEQRVALFNKLGTILIPRQSAEEANAEETKDEYEFISIGVDGIDNEPDPPPLPPEILKEMAEDKAKRAAGRPKGSLNKKTIETRERLKQIYLSEFHYIKSRLDDLPPEKRVAFLLQVAKLVTPYETAKSIRQKEEPQEEQGATYSNYGNGWVKGK